MRVDAYGSDAVTQTAYFAYSGYIKQRKCIGGTWGEWEWVNPRMLLGVEYRTTEMWNGRPVYTELISLGALPNATTKIINTGIQISSGRVISFHTIASNVTSCIDCSQYKNITALYVYNESDYINILIGTDADLTDFGGYTLLKYYKD